MEIDYSVKDLLYQELAKITEEKIQTAKENIWLVLSTDLQMKSRTYHIDNYDGSFTKILDDITEFLSSRKQSKFKIIKS
ncbi:MAG: hypothetical protein XU09_C0008G0057 [Thaumarchaeota archaeon CSP1-1]|nr:MAG: hypothetical protein XU09_C0008G0057 [Thaumarchaeota archaeon CSP1-1]